MKRTILALSAALLFCATLFAQGNSAADGNNSRPLHIYSLPRFEQACAAIRHFEGWHTPRPGFPYVGYGHRLLPGEHFPKGITRAQGDSILRADLSWLCRLFADFGRDSLLLACLAYQVGPYRLLRTKDHPESTLLQKLRRGDRNIESDYLSYSHWKGKYVASIRRRRAVELRLLFTK